MKRSTKIIVGSLVGLGLVGVVTAKQFDHGPGCSYGQGSGSEYRGGWITKRIAWKLDLNEQQENELNDLKASVFKGLDSMRAERLTADQIQSILNTELDQVKAVQLLAQRLELVEQNAPALIAAFAEFYDGLDSAQQAEVSEMIEYRMSHKGRHWRDHNNTGERGANNG